MSNVYDIWSGEPIKLKKPRASRGVVTVIESIYQRRNQIEEIIVVFIEKGTYRYGAAKAVSSEYSARSLTAYMEDFAGDLIDGE